MKQHPKVSVVIPTYNRAGSVVRAIESALSQTYPDKELIVVDDGSTDDTARVLLPYDGRIRCIRLMNSGPAAARNRGIKAAGGEWMAFLDSDDVWLPNKLEVQLEECARADADVCFHDVRFTGPAGEDIPSWNAYVSGESLRRPAIGTGLMPDAYQIMMTAGHLFLTTTLLVRRSALEESGCFDEGLRTSEDLELYFRLAARYRVAYVSEALAAYSPGTHRVTDKERIYKDRIAAISSSLADRLKAGDDELSRWARTGLLQEMRSLCGAYRRSGSYGRAVRAYLKYFSMKNARMERLLEMVGGTRAVL